MSKITWTGPYLVEVKAKIAFIALIYFFDEKE